MITHPSWAWDERPKIDLGRLKTAEPWVQLARFEGANIPVIDAPVFSTFAGEAPDVWPEIETAAPGWWRAAVAGLLAALGIWAAWLTLGPVWRTMTRVGVRS